MSKVMTDNTGKVIMANNKAYIPPANGNVDDVKVNGESVVEDKVANIDLTSYANKDYVDSKIGNIESVIDSINGEV